MTGFSGVFCGPSDRVRPKPEEESAAAPTSSEIRRAHKMRRQTGGYIRPKQQPAPTTTTIIPEEEGLLAPVAQPEDFMGTVEMGEAASMLPPPLIRYVKCSQGITFILGMSLCARVDTFSFDF